MMMMMMIIVISIIIINSWLTNIRSPHQPGSWDAKILSRSKRGIQPTNHTHKSCLSHLNATFLQIPFFRIPLWGAVIRYNFRIESICLRGTKGVPRKWVWTSVNMRVWTCKEWGVKQYQTSGYLRPPFLETPLVPSKSCAEVVATNPFPFGTGFKTLVFRQRAGGLAGWRAGWPGCRFCIEVMRWIISIYLSFFLSIYLYLSLSLCIYIYIYIYIHTYIRVHTYNQSSLRDRVQNLVFRWPDRMLLCRSSRYRRGRSQMQQIM